MAEKSRSVDNFAAAAYEEHKCTMTPRRYPWVMNTATESGQAVTTPHELPALGVVLVAAGRGERLGAEEPKAFVKLGGRTLVEHCIDAIFAMPHSGHLVIVAPQSRAADTLALAEAAMQHETNWEVSVVAGGRERHESVRFGLEVLPEHIDVALIHDAARPLTPTAQFERVTAEVHRSGSAVIPVLPVADTLKRIDAGGIVHETVDRGSLVSVQTPQGFPRELIAAAHETLRDGSTAGESPTDDAEVVQRAGGTVRTVMGDVLAHKLTTPGDLVLLQALLNTRDGGTQ